MTTTRRRRAHRSASTLRPTRRRLPTIVASYRPPGQKHPIPRHDQLLPFLKEQPAPPDRDVIGDCLVWTGCVGQDGYGVVHYRRAEDGKPMTGSAHRLYWKARYGYIPPKIELDHTCKVRHCVRHLEPVTHRENVRRSDSPAGLNFRKERCDRGHEPEWGHKPGKEEGRYCKACLREDSRELRARRAMVATTSTDA